MLTLQLVLISVLGAALLVMTAKGVRLAHTLRQQERAVTAEWEAAKERKPAAVPEPKVPCDTSRPYPRPKGSRSKLNRICPVCGTGSETTELDARLFGWQAHGSCVEWLGDWHPRSLRAASPVQSGGANTVVFTAKGPITALGGGGGGTGSVNVVTRGPGDGSGASYPIASENDLAAQEMVLNGFASLDDVRARILSAYSVPEPAVWSAAGDRQPLSFEARSVPCPDCGTYFEGTAQGVRQSFDRHRGSARCAEHRKLRNLRAR